MRKKTLLIHKEDIIIHFILLKLQGMVANNQGLLAHQWIKHFPVNQYLLVIVWNQLENHLSHFLSKPNLSL
jgi:hypothetical protein